MAGLSTGLDLGGSKIEAIVLDRDGAERARMRVPAPVEGYDATLAAIVALVEEVERAAGGAAASIGIGTPGALSASTGLMRNANSTCLNGHALDRDLEAALGRPAHLANDANCFALAEARAGAGKGAGVVLGVILGTGVGAGIVIDQRPVVGRNRIAGEWGHNPLPGARGEELPGALCDCGRRGCIEAWCSGPGLAADHFRTTGSEMPPAMIASFAEAGDMAARESLDRHVDRLGRALAGAVNLLDPDVIVLGGGLSQLDHLYRELPKAMRGHVFSDTFETPIVRNALGDAAGVYGAAWLCPVED